MVSDKGFGENAIRKAVGITETSLRDGHQSLMATRMRTDDMLPVVDMMEEVGFHSLEVWGGATFDTCMRFLDEDPWERLRTLRRHFKKSKLQMLLRGQNIVGYRHYADDTVREFVKRAVGNGLDIIRIFDALNDLRNMEIAADQVKKEGAHLQMAISYTISPVHTLEAFLQMALDMVSMGADSICIKDMAGLLGPVDAYKLVKGIKEKANVPVQMHTHYTSGLASMAYLAAIMAGADVVDCAISPFAMGTSQPATETFVAALHGSPYDTGLSLEKLIPIAEYLKKVREKYSHLFTGMQGVDVNVLAYQIQVREPAQGAKRLGQTRYRAERGRARAPRDGLPAARNANQPARGDTGHPECLGGGAVEGGAKGGTKLFPWAFRQAACSR